GALGVGRFIPERLVEPGIRRRQCRFGLGVPLPNAIRLNLGGCLLDLERYAEAEAALTTSYARLNKTLGDETPYTERARQKLIEVYEAWGRPEQAAALRAAAPDDEASDDAGESG
ncbi:MAG: tetratricopeptide repeat protein, partial [Bacteroidota bacterium]